MKIKVALFSGKLALALDRRVGNYFKNLVDSTLHINSYKLIKQDIFYRLE